MLAKVSVTCDQTELTKYSHLVVVLTSEGMNNDEVKSRVRVAEGSNNESIRFVDDGDEMSNTLLKYRSSDENFLRDAGQANRWVAYFVDVTPRYPTTTLPV